jgi:hypothetical protein
MKCHGITPKKLIESNEAAIYFSISRLKLYQWVEGEK